MFLLFGAAAKDTRQGLKEKAAKHDVQPTHEWLGKIFRQILEGASLRVAASLAQVRETKCSRIYRKVSWLF